MGYPKTKRIVGQMTIGINIEVGEKTIKNLDEMTDGIRDRAWGEELLGEVHASSIINGRTTCSDLDVEVVDA